jgi:type IV pilus assembly protein PilW
MRTRVRVQHGFTLVELMISLTLGLLIILALVTMLINVNRNNTELSKTNRVIENGRFSLQLLTADVSHAGYWGAFVPKFDDFTVTDAPAAADLPNAVPDPCLAFSPANWTDQHKTNLLSIAAQGTDIPSVVPSPTTPFCASIVTNPQPRTDVLVVRHAEACLPGSSTDDCSDTRAEASPHLYFQASLCAADAASSFVLNTSTFSLRAGDCDPLAAPPVATPAPVRRFSSSIYFVRNYANSAGDGIPTLVRAKFGVNNTAVAGNTPEFLPAQALVEGVEGFRIEYGLDNISDTGAPVNLAALALPIDWGLNPVALNTPANRGNGLPDIYVRCSQATPCTVDQLVNVTAIRLYVLVRSEKSSPGHVDTKKYCLASVCTDPADYMGPFNDGYKRHLFTQTIRLTNVASRRETP